MSKAVLILLHVESIGQGAGCRGREGLKAIKSLPIGIEGVFMSKM
jgi:hypothetical protein